MSLQLIIWERGYFRRLVPYLIALFVFLFCSLLPSSILPLLMVEAGLEGSKHDLRIPGIAEPPCMYCHLPHKDAEEPPLWDRETERRSWSLRPLKREKASSAKICLGCHDGNIAQDVTAFIPSEELRKERYLMQKGFHSFHGLELADDGTDHPVGISLRKIAKYNTDLRSEPHSALKLKKGRIDCTTCHSVHAETPYKGFLVIDNTNSDLCLGCHIK
ncbi:MAG: cytochrome c3 family protein [Thermodesulfovibrionales bacterium]|nr:cytochrome c3 family protein [Thermodesulfovibrionales bacterium]